jgi:hypothetical protein
VDTTHGELVEKELNIMSTRRHDRRVAEDGERRALEMWQESEGRYDERRREANRQAWASYHEGQAERHRRTLEDLITHQETQAAKLCEGEGVSS